MAQIDGGLWEQPVLDTQNVTSVAVMSDLHLGAGRRDRVDSTRPDAPVPGKCVLDEDGQLERLSALLAHHQVYVDVLVLNGDMCDFALATMSRTLASARRFVQRLAPHCKELVYLPGNHDHHAWLLANELHELLLPFPDVADGYLQRTDLRRLAAPEGEESTRDIRVAYPNLYWKPRNAGGRTYVFHHGHYCEDLYSIIWTLLAAAFPRQATGNLESLEAASFGWLEMIWYQLGQAGKGLGADGIIEHLYGQLERDGSGALEQPLRDLYATLLGPIVHRAIDARLPTAGPHLHALVDHHLPGVVLHMMKSYAETKASTRRGPGASSLRFAALDAALARRCDQYLERTRASRGGLPSLDRISFFFGHTHVAGAWPAGGTPRLFNDGGWIRHPDGGWPDAHVLVLSDDGAVRDLTFAEDPAACRYETVRGAAED
jgi:hypothetical protein